MWKIGQPYSAEPIRALETSPLGGSGGFPPFKGAREQWNDASLVLAIGKAVLLSLCDAELLGQGFTYAAIGHYHSFGAIEDGSGPRAAYSGCIQGRGLDETGRNQGKPATVADAQGNTWVLWHAGDAGQRRVEGEDAVARTG